MSESHSLKICVSSRIKWGIRYSDRWTLRQIGISLVEIMKNLLPKLKRTEGNQQIILSASCSGAAEKEQTESQVRSCTWLPCPCNIYSGERLFLLAINKGTKLCLYGNRECRAVCIKESSCNACWSYSLLWSYYIIIIMFITVMPKGQLVNIRENSDGLLECYAAHKHLLLHSCWDIMIWTT